MVVWLCSSFPCITLHIQDFSQDNSACWYQPVTTCKPIHNHNKAFNICTNGEVFPTQSYIRTEKVFPTIPLLCENFKCCRQWLDHTNKMDTLLYPVHSRMWKLGILVLKYVHVYIQYMSFNHGIAARPNVTVHDNSSPKMIWK